MYAIPVREYPSYFSFSPWPVGRRWQASVLAMLLCAGVAYAAPHGELDAGFGDNGRVVFSGNDNQALYTLVEQPSDGKLLAAGYATAPEGDIDFLVMRLNPDGSPDATFGANGSAVIDFGGNGDYAKRIAVMPDGKIVVVGTSYVDYGSYGFAMGDFAVARLNPDGTLDTTFGDDGRVTLDLGGGTEEPQGLSVLADGSIVVAGPTDASGRQATVLAKFGTDGALDTSFGTGSVAGTTMVETAGINNVTRWLTVQPDGKYVTCGVAWGDTAELSHSSLVLRLHADGSVDTGFGTDGVAIIEASSHANACVVTADGAILIAGENWGNLAFARLMPDGTPDTTFGNAGVSLIDLGGIESVNSMVLLDDGQVGVTGSTWMVTPDAYGSGSPMPNDLLFARFDPVTASLDLSFGNDGVTVVDFGVENRMGSAHGESIIQQADGKLLAAGSALDARSYSRAVLARVDPAGNGSKGLVGFVMTMADFVEDVGVARIGVRRTGGSVGDVTVDYATSPVSAQSASDFMETSGTLTWSSGDVDMKFIEVPIINDSVGEPIERFSIELSNASSGLAAGKFSVRIVNDDAFPAPGNDSPSSSGGGAMSLGTLLLLVIALLGRAVARPRCPGTGRFSRQG